MKTLIKSAGLLALCAPVMFSCNNDLDNVSSGNKVPVELSLVVNNLNTRTTPSLGEGHLITTAWTNGDVVGLFTGNSHGVYTTSDAGATWTATTALEVEENKTHTFYGYYPYSSSNVNVGAIDCSVSSDQTTIANFAASDVLRGEATNTGNGTAVTMEMNHVNALIKIQISGTHATGNVQATLKNVRTKGSFILSTGAVTSETVGDVKMYKIAGDTDANVYTFIAVVPAQNIATGTKFVEILANEQTYSFAHTADVVVGSGDLQPIAITVGPKVANMEIDGNFTIGNWTPKGEIGGDAEVVVPEPEPAKELITELYPTTWASSSLADASTVAGWFKAGNTSLSVTENIISWSGNNPNWYNNYIGYRYSGVVLGEKYLLKFNVYAENTPTTESEGTEQQTTLEYKIVVGAKAAYSSIIADGAATSNNWMVPILLNEASSSPLYYRTTNITSTDTEYTFILDFSGLYNGAANTATIVTTGDNLETAIATGDLFFSNIVTGSTAKIHGVKLTQIVE